MSSNYSAANRFIPFEQLENLLQADKKRKLKFQKPEKQRQWQEELDKLWQQLD